MRAHADNEGENFFPRFARNNWRYAPLSPCLRQRHRSDLSAAPPLGSFRRPCKGLPNNNESSEWSSEELSNPETELVTKPYQSGLCPTQIQRANALEVRSDKRNQEEKVGERDHN